MILTLGRNPDKNHLLEATPGAVVCGFHMADIIWADGAERYAPMSIIFIHPDQPPELDLFTAAGVTP